MSAQPGKSLQKYEKEDPSLFIGPIMRRQHLEGRIQAIKEKHDIPGNSAAQPPATTAESAAPEARQRVLRRGHEQAGRAQPKPRTTELRETEDDTDAVLARYRDLYEFAPVGYLTLDRGGTIRAMNLTCGTQLGIDRSRLLGRHFGLLVANQERSDFSGFLDKVFKSRAKETCELQLREGGKRPAFVQIEAVSAASGRECHAVLIDISARRRQAEQVNAVHAKLAARSAVLQEANFELEAFNYTVSHDLCNPLTSINGFSLVLLRICENQIDEESKGYLKGIHQSALRMQRIIVSLLDFSRAAHVGICREAMDLSEMAKAAVAQLKLSAPESRVVFRISEGITCTGDAGLCRIAMDNLLDNSWKYSGGRAGTVIEFGTTELGGKPVYFVCDNGPGFDLAQAGKLFSPFQRIPGMAARGHGIGLATVKRIVKRHGGRVWAESSPGEGATFFFTLE